QLWITPSQFTSFEFFKLHIALLKAVKHCFAVRIAFSGEPQDAGWLEELRTVYARKQFLPSPERALGHARVDRIRPVAHANNARLATRAGPAVARSIGINQQHRGAR